MFDNLVISLCKFTTLLNAPEVSVVKSSEYLSLFLKGHIFCQEMLRIKKFVDFSLIVARGRLGLKPLRLPLPLSWRC